METINGRILPVDPDRRAQTAATVDDSLATQWDSGPLPPQPHSQREAGLSDAECTIASARKRKLDPSQNSHVDRAPAAEPVRRYVELSELGRGGWGVVQRALDRQLHRQVAIKRISNPGRIQPEEREQFLHEARVTSGLQHPGVVPIHELVSDDHGDTYYVMKLLEGDTLRHHIRLAHAQQPSERWQRHEWLEAITPLLMRFIDVCNAVAYAHRRGIIHRDLKPTNVMAGEFGETIVVDWGLARYIDDTADETTIQGVLGHVESSASRRSSAPQESEGSVIGTPVYMAPEQARGELASLGIQSDVYSLGVILYEIIAGNHAHMGLDIKAVLHRVRAGEFTALSQSQPCVPRALEEIVHTAMSPEPCDRYRDVESLAEDVRRFLTGQRVSVHHETIVERTVRWCSRHRAIASTIGIAALVLLIVSVLSSIVIRSAHRAEKQARIEAHQAHHEALQRLVDARHTADTWLVDLSGSLQFHPAMTPLRNELIGQAIEQYQRLIAQPIDPIAEQIPATMDEDTFKTNTFVWLERAKCQLRLGDLYHLRGQSEPSQRHIAIADDILRKLNHATTLISTVSLHPFERRVVLESDWMDHQGALDDLVRLEQINCLIGRSLATEQAPNPSETVLAREQFARWIPLLPPTIDARIPSDFVARVISASVRLELIVERTQDPFSGSQRPTFSADRFRLAAQWAHWLAETRGKPSDYQLYETIAVEQADRFSEIGDDLASYRSWSELIDHLNKRLTADGQRSDWMQSLAHAKIRRAEAAVKLGRTDEAALDYTAAIDDLERTWLLADADEFFRTNLATAENNLGRLWSDGNDEQRQAARRLFSRSIATYQQLLSESATPDILRRLAQTHFAMADAIDIVDETADVHPDDATASVPKESKSQHLKNARLAFEILRDQDLLLAADHLAWAETLVALMELGDATVDAQRVRELVAKIDPDALRQPERLRLEQLKQRLR